MKLSQLTDKAINKRNFLDLEAYINFCGEYLNYIQCNLQATIVSQNETHYRFYQYNEEGHFQITRPINSKLMFDADRFTRIAKDFVYLLNNIRDIKKDDQNSRDIINKSTYTIQQSIGCVLDALPAGTSNTARKLNGDLFEYFIRLIIKEIGIPNQAGVIKIPVFVNQEKQCDFSYQHDLIIQINREIKLIGSIKTSSKDRIDKIFIDKFLYNQLTQKATPHIAIFLNDVQRKKSKAENRYGINSTFLPGHFKGYTIKINPLDGVYYCDIRPNMQTDRLLKEHIKTFDCLLIDDIWKFL